jgi:hypothetical protein
MTKGEYPASMRQTVGARLPTFTPEQLKVRLESCICAISMSEEDLICCVTLIRRASIDLFLVPFWFC